MYSCHSSTWIIGVSILKANSSTPSLPQSIIGVLSYATFIFLLLIGLALLVYVLDIKIRAAKGDNSPPKYGAYVVLTGSMLPEIQVYDVVITKQVDAKTLEEVNKLRKKVED